MWFVPVQVISIFLPIASHLSLLIYSLLFPQCSLSLSLTLTHTHTTPTPPLQRPAASARAPVGCNGPSQGLSTWRRCVAGGAPTPRCGCSRLGRPPPPIAASVSLDGCRRPLPLPPRAMCRVSYACHLHLSSSPLRRVPNLAMLYSGEVFTVCCPCMIPVLRMF